MAIGRSPSPSPNLLLAELEEFTSMAEEILARWEDTRVLPSYSSENLPRLLLAINNLHRARKLTIEDSSPSCSRLLRSQILMEKAMKRLQIELRRVLRDRDNEASELQSIARCMVNCGYGKECISVYRLVRRSVIEEGLYTLGFSRPVSAQLRKLPWEAIEDSILSWAAAAKPAVRDLFRSELALSYETFSFSSSIRDTLFGDVASEAAVEFFAFPERIVSKVRLTPEKIFRLLDLYETILELLQEIQSVFSHQSTLKVRSQVETSLAKLGDAVRFLIEELEFAIKKDNTKTMIQGGGLHPLVRYVANFLSLLSDYNNAVEDIFFADSTTRKEDSPRLQVSFRLGMIIFDLLCKLDTKAGIYGDPALGYLFLANNLQYLVRKVQKGRLVKLLGEDWVTANAARARQYAESYKRLAWKEVMETMPEDLTDTDGSERMRRFNEAFSTACRRQEGWIIADEAMEKEVNLSISTMLMEAYRPLYMKCRGDKRSSAEIRFLPEDLANYVSDIFWDSHGSIVCAYHH